MASDMADTPISKPETSGVRSGSCLCGGVRYELSGEPTVKVLCHCNNCGKSSGLANWWYNTTLSSFGFSVAKDFRIIEGQNIIRTYEDSKTDSGDTVQRSFCSICGSPLFIMNAKFDRAVIVTKGTMNGAIEWTPQQEYYCKRKEKYVSNMKIAEGFMAMS
ncbi:hypothetical protein MMC18_007204 [Xylographa bjoerkii]|nr:hypothetical protein [Xylographa bjoerkii]